MRQRSVEAAHASSELLRTPAPALTPRVTPGAPVAPGPERRKPKRDPPASTDTQRKRARMDALLASAPESATYGAKAVPRKRAADDLNLLSDDEAEERLQDMIEEATDAIWAECAPRGGKPSATAAPVAAPRAYAQGKRRLEPATAPSVSTSRIAATNGVLSRTGAAAGSGRKRARRCNLDEMDERAARVRVREMLEEAETEARAELTRYLAESRAFWDAEEAKRAAAPAPPPTHGAKRRRTEPKVRWKTLEEVIRMDHMLKLAKRQIAICKYAERCDRRRSAREASAIRSSSGTSKRSSAGCLAQRITQG